jgi:hypothetical protein
LDRCRCSLPDIIVRMTGQWRLLGSSFENSVDHNVLFIGHRQICGKVRSNVKAHIFLCVSVFQCFGSWK